jgi:hypothetical protein
MPVIFKAFPSIMIVDFVSQVDDEGYVIQDAFVNAVGNWYTEYTLKTLARDAAPDCVTAANDDARGR